MKKFAVLSVCVLALLFSKEVSAQSYGSSFKPAFDVLVGGQSDLDSTMRPVYGAGVHASVLGNDSSVRLGVGILAGATSFRQTSDTRSAYKNLSFFMLTVPFSFKLADDGTVGTYLTLSYGRSLVVGGGKNFNTFLAGISIGST